MPQPNDATPSAVVSTKHFVAHIVGDADAWSIVLFTADNTPLSANGWGLGGHYPSLSAASDKANAVLSEADMSVDRGLALKARDEEFIRGGH